MSESRDRLGDPAGELTALAVRLERERPLPSTALRGALGRRLAARGRPHPRPPHVHRMIAAYAGSGALLLLVAALSAAGVGPLG